MRQLWKGSEREAKFWKGKRKNRLIYNERNYALGEKNRKK